jgi:hypothetical protein
MKEKVLNLIELNDLIYHSQVIEILQELLKQNPNMFSKKVDQAFEEGSLETQMDSQPSPSKFKNKTSITKPPQSPKQAANKQSLG